MAIQVEMCDRHSIGSSGNGKEEMLITDRECVPMPSLGSVPTSRSIRKVRPSQVRRRVRLLFLPSLSILLHDPDSPCSVYGGERCSLLSALGLRKTARLGHYLAVLVSSRVR
jgi:hypothetical protein